LGPVQEYVAPPIGEAVKFNGDPSQTGELLPAIGADGIGLTVTVETAEFVHPKELPVTV